MNVFTELLILRNMELELDAHVHLQNITDRSISYPLSTEESRMREISNLASTLQGTIAALKSAASAATTNFQNEVAHSKASLAKVNAFTADLAAANKEVEAMLADTGSNFPNVSSSTVSSPDKNGVVTKG